MYISEINSKILLYLINGVKYAFGFLPVLCSLSTKIAQFSTAKHIQIMNFAKAHRIKQNRFATKARLLPNFDSEKEKFLRISQSDAPTCLPVGVITINLTQKSTNLIKISGLKL